MNNDDMNNAMGFYSPWTWRDRLRAKLFPSRHCETPDYPTAADCTIVRTGVCFDWRDTLRFLVTRKLMVETRTSTENAVGRTSTTSVAYVVTSFREAP